MLIHQLNKFEKGLQYTYINRRIKKRKKNQEFIKVINSTLRNNDLKYSIKNKNKDIIINKKMLSLLAVNEPKFCKFIILNLKGINYDKSTTI